MPFYSLSLRSLRCVTLCDWYTVFVVLLFSTLVFIITARSSHHKSTKQIFIKGLRLKLISPTLDTNGKSFLNKHKLVVSVLTLFGYLKYNTFLLQFLLSHVVLLL